MRSMTGFGRGEAHGDGLRVTVEIKTVNRRQLEVVVSLPRELEPLEPRVRSEISGDLSRGRCEVRVQVERDGTASDFRIDRAAAVACARELAAVAAELGWRAPDSVDLLLRCPGVVVGARQAGNDFEDLWPAVSSAVGSACTAMQAMRADEGTALEADLVGRMGTLREGHTRIAARAPEVPRRQRELLLGRLRAAGLEGVASDDERVLKEVMLFAERCDISEELARLTSHFAQFDRCRSSAEPVGRTLDFLCQEMHREINTIGSKANDAAISAEVVAFKAELERFREQVQNIE